jgi:photosystem II stability/assembly factor-like uncharacterized protein
VIESYRAQFQNTEGDRFEAGQPSEIIVSYSIYDALGLSDEPFRVEFEVIEGGGQLSAGSVYTDTNNVATTGWKLGNSSFRQTVRATSYRADGKRLTWSDYSVYAYRKGEWDEVSTSPDGNMSGMAADTVAGVTLMLSGSTIYRQSDKYYKWERLNNSQSFQARTMHMGRDNFIYISTWNGEVYKTSDHGNSWIKCSKPYPDHPYYIYFYVANDNWLWAYKFDYPTKFSKDGGKTWQEAGSSLSSYGFGDVFRLKNGSLLFHGSNCCSLSRSDDDGASWTHIETPAFSHKLYVRENDEIFLTTQENGCTIYRSVNMGATWQRLYGVYPEFGTSMDNVFNKFGDTYYVQIPGYGVLRSKDLLTYEPFYLNYEIRNLFIDHNGVLIAKDWNSSTVWYFNPE